MTLNSTHFAIMAIAFIVGIAYGFGNGLDEQLIQIVTILASFAGIREAVRIAGRIKNKST